MAISTLAGLITGLQFPRDYMQGSITTSPTGVNSCWGQTIIPSPGTWDTTLNGVTLDSTSSQVTGQIYFPAPAANGYLAKIELSANSGLAQFLLCDRLWHNGGMSVTSTSTQSITSPTFPARDNNGATAGEGLLIGLEISSTVGASAPFIQVSYTNSLGVSGRTATTIVGTYTATTGSMYEMTLQSGDTGVQSIQSINLNQSWLSGTMNLVVYRPLAYIPILNKGSASLAPAIVDAVAGGMQRLYTGTVPYFLSYSSCPAINGKILFADG
jgi:hypothetical protein